MYLWSLRAFFLCFQELPYCPFWNILERVFAKAFAAMAAFIAAGTQWSLNNISKLGKTWNFFWNLEYKISFIFKITFIGEGLRNIFHKIRHRIQLLVGISQYMTQISTKNFWDTFPSFAFWNIEGRNVLFLIQIIPQSALAMRALKSKYAF